MHPALTRYVDPPQRHTARYIALGAVMGTIAVIAAVSVVALAEHHYLRPPEHDELQASTRDHRCAASSLESERVLEAHDTVIRYALHAVPTWRSARSRQACPTHVDELEVYLARSSTIDPWGRSYQIACSGNAAWARSAGPDGTFDTIDDVRSDR
jgi:hypothetical protein